MAVLHRFYCTSKCIRLINELVIAPLRPKKLGRVTWSFFPRVSSVFQQNRAKINVSPPNHKRNDENLTCTLHVNCVFRHVHFGKHSIPRVVRFRTVQGVMRDVSS